MKQKIGGCVIFFNPDTRVIDNVLTYKNEVDILIIVDNSPEQNHRLIKQLKELPGELVYQWLEGNHGIAKALNIACEIAFQNGCEWILTMDQDSKFKDKDASKLIRSLSSITASNQNPAIVSPFHALHSGSVSPSDKIFEEVKVTMTSGNLLNLGIHKMISGFEEKLFIDYVDHEYCLRSRKNNFKIIQNNEVSLEHSLGNFQLKTFFGKTVGISNHNHVRRYYITRNGLYTVRKYFFFDIRFCWEIIKSLLLDVGRIIFFEEDKIRKIKAVWRGAWHFLINRYGKYSFNS